MILPLEPEQPIVHVQQHAYEKNVLMVTVTANGASDEEVNSIIDHKLAEWRVKHHGAVLEELPDEEFIDSQANVTRYYAITYR